MRSIASMLAIIVLGFGLSGCPGGGGGASGGSTAAFAVSTTAADFGVVGNNYTSTLAATGGTAPLTWAFVGGTLPTGLGLTNAVTGEVTGTPALPADNFTATFTVTDSTGKTATGSVLFAIHTKTDILSVDNNTPPAPSSGGSSTPSISDDGRLVAFVSSASLLSLGGVGTQIYVHDWQTNQTALISRSGTAPSPIGGSGASSAPSISGNGRFVAFVSDAQDLLPTGSPSITSRQIYVHDRQLGVTSLVSKDTGGNPVSGGAIIISPSINGDGRFVAYVSNATTIVSGVGGQQVYLYDRQTDVTSLVSRDSAGAINPGNLVSSTPSINFDGRFVAFVSNSTNLVTGVSVAPQIYLRDVQIGATSLVSKDSLGNPVSGGSTIISPTISGDGSFVAYVSDMPNIVPGVGGQQVYLYNGQTDVTSLVSKDNSLTPQEGNGPSSAPSISNDGCFVAFASQSSNLGSSANQIYIRGPLAVAGCAGSELTTLVSKDDGGSPATSAVGATIDPSVNGNGEFVAFSSTATDLISPAPSGNRQIYVRALP